jgi:tRNA A-37 threonylcarbamoyl transferase component Bud32
MLPPSHLATALVDRYRIERELGQGGMATVYLAYDLKHDREVAIKVLRPELAAVLGPERFLAEIKITARLDHPHILTLIDSGASDGFLYYVLPFVRGESLRDKLNREKQLGLDETLTITRQVASALDYAHHHGVVHRDIKPENILLHEGEAVLTDFGIALAVKEAGGNRLTETGISLGTPQYMSPEQATGDRRPDARSDAYSLAAVLYEMLAGEPPHTGPTVQAVIAKLLTERPTGLRVVRNTVPEGIDAAVAKALAKVPADRFPSAGEFVRALSGAVAPGSPSAPSRIRPLLPASVVGAVVLAVVTWALLHRSTTRVVQPDRVQLTFTGNARTPALSGDGRRLAYCTRQCDEQGYCTTDVVVQDVGGAGSATVLRGWASIWQLEWSGDGRFLLVSGLQGPARPYGLFSVPALGGEPRLLGNFNIGGAMVANSDTVLAIRDVAGDTVTWLRWITIADGLTRDSLPLFRRPGTSFNAWPFPDGRRVMLIHSDAAGWTATVMTRLGRRGDSLRVNLPLSQVISLGGDGRVLLVRSRASPIAEDFDLLAYRVGESGQLADRPDTVLRQLRGTVASAANGMLLLASGPVQQEVWAMRRDGSASMRFTQRRLATATSDLTGRVSPAGDRILLSRTVLQGGGATTGFSVMPFDGGAETPVAGSAGAFAAGWSWDGKSVGAFWIEGDSYHLRSIDLASGHARPLAAISVGSVWTEPQVLHGGGITFVNPFGIRRLGVPGVPDTTFVIPEFAFRSIALANSPDGQATAWVGFDPNGDSLLVERVSLLDGSMRRLAAFYADGAGGAFWLSDGSLLLQIRETAATLAWYRLPAGGGPPVRLGSPPRYPAEYTMSLDGRRVVANVQEDRPDIYLIRNFAELWRR